MLGMNIVNQREIVKRMAEVRLLSPKALGLALGAPVFVWDLPGEGRGYGKEEMEFLRSSVLEPGTDFPRLVPFPLFRVATREGFDLWFRTGARSLACMSYKRSVALGPPGTPESEMVLEHIYRWVREEGGVPGGAEAVTHIRGSIVTLINWRVVPEEKSAALKKRDPGKFEEMFMGPLHDLHGFLFDIEYPGNVVLKVGPAEKPGKSVEWRQARTHYCILWRGDARACRRDPYSQIDLSTSYSRTNQNDTENWSTNGF